MKNLKSILSVALTLIMILSIIPLSSIKVEAATLTQSQFDTKLSEVRKMYPQGSQKYEWSVNGSVVGWQCHGYGRWLSWYVWGVDFANGRGTNWTLYKSTASSTYVDKLVPGDVIRYRNSTSNTWNHTIFITKISGNTIYYTDCNSDGNNTIKWDRTVSKSTLTSYLKNTLYGSEAATYGYIAHYTPNTLSVNGLRTLSIKYDANGGIIAGSDKKYDVYKVAISEGVNLRSGAGTSYSTLVAMPKGTSFVVTETKKANGYTWGKTTYNSKTGWCVISEDWTTKTGTRPQTNYYLNSSDIVYKSSTGKVFVQAMVDGTTYSDGLYNYTTFGISRTGYTFKGWGTKESGGTIYNQNDSMTAKKLCSTIGDGDKTITLYAIWEPNVLSVAFNANGGEISSDTYNLNGNVIYKDGSKYVQNWVHNSLKTDGLVNATTFGLTKKGYSFIGWGTTSTGGTVFDQHDASLLATDINSNVKNGNCSTTLYAIWKANTYTVKYNANGGTGTISDSSHIYDTEKNLNANTFTRTGYTFLGWSTGLTATTAQYTDKQSVKNLTATNGGTVTLYAVWSKNAHTPGTWTVVTSATCTSTGLTIQKCTVCGEVIAEKELPVIEHTSSGWEVIIQASCVMDGMRQKSCTVCNTIIIKEEIVATGHSVGEWEIITEATCSTEGFRHQKCKVCKDVINSEEIPTTEHIPGEWVVIRVSTCKETGLQVQECIECGGELANEEISTIEHTFVNGYCTTCGEEDPSYTEPEYNYSFTIQTPSRTEIRHKDGIKLHAKVEGTAPDGSYVVWTASNSKFKTEEINNGNSLKIVSDSNGKTTFTATLHSADGEVLATDTIEMKSKAGFFDKIGGFFRSLFGATKVYEY